MKITVLKETASYESRVAIHPESIKKYINLGFEVYIEQGAGEKSYITDEEYKLAGAKISKVPLELIPDADIILRVQNPENNKNITDFLKLTKKGVILIGLLSPYNNLDILKDYANRGITSLAMELIPRISRAQTMDVLSSQSNLAGYKAVIEAANEFSGIFPMMMTAAGTIAPAKVLVIGAGVAGLQAIATAKRLGASVFAFDVRPETKEQVQSLGANFIEVESDETGLSKGGYAKEMSENYKQKQSNLIHETIKKSDIVITTALIPGKLSPKLISKNMVEDMKPGSVIVDLAAINGGNCELTEIDKVVEYKNVKIIGYSNTASKVAKEASKLYSKNLYNFVELLVDKDNKKIDINLKDEIISESLITFDGEIIHPKFKGDK